MRNIFIGALVAGLSLLSGCVALGLSQSESETGYTIAATAGDVFIISGKATPDATAQLCTADNANYKILISTRNVADGVKSYAPADNAHVALQTDGAKLSGVCVPPPPQ